MNEILEKYIEEHGAPPKEIIMADEITPRDPENWVRVDGGWMKVGHSQGNAGYFSQEQPPVRDTMDRPLTWNGTDWVIDNARLIQEVNEGKWHPK